MGRGFLGAKVLFLMDRMRLCRLESEREALRVLSVLRESKSRGAAPRGEDWEGEDDGEDGEGDPSRKLVGGFRGAVCPGEKGGGRLPEGPVMMLRLRREGKSHWNVHCVFSSEGIIRKGGLKPILLCSIER